MIKLVIAAMLFSALSIPVVCAEKSQIVGLDAHLCYMRINDSDVRDVVGSVWGGIADCKLKSKIYGADLSISAGYLQSSNVVRSTKYIISMVPIMVNARYRLDQEGDGPFYVGLGMGYVRTKTGIVGEFTNFSNDFAWQLIIGAKAANRFFAEAKYFDGSKPRNTGLQICAGVTF